MNTSDDTFSAILSELDCAKPALAEQARTLLSEDEGFRAICQDFEDAMATAQQFAASQEASETRAEMHRSLARDLMAEAITYLNRHRTGETH